MSDIRRLSQRRCAPGTIRAVLFDFDGTISTLRQGWEGVMKPMMAEYIGQGGVTPEQNEMIARYIDQSTGIQTIYQMQWLAEQAANNADSPARDAWWYKDEYNRRLMKEVSGRVERVKRQPAEADNYRIAGAVEFLEALRQRGIPMYLASGTDHEDVAAEAEALGVSQYFTLIMGAPSRRADCSKEAVIRLMLEQEKLAPEALLVVGDGKVEIGLGAAIGAWTLGLASDEAQRQGINPEKTARLAAAGADLLAGDFLDMAGLLSALGFNGGTGNV